VRQARSPIAGIVLAVAVGVGFSVLLMSVAVGASRGIKQRLSVAGRFAHDGLNVPHINAILTDLTVVVAAAMLAQTAISTYVLGRSTMNTRREEIALRRQSGVLRRTLVLEFLARVAQACLIGGLVGEAAGIGLSVVLRRYSALPVHFTVLSVVGAFPTAVVLAMAATTIPAWRTANVSPALVRRS
jgi:ABC-type antimicrobial peptide transport system permease subunit